MKLQIDTIGKIITLEESVLLADLLTFLEQIFPEGAWKEYTLNYKPIIVEKWNNPAPPISIPWEPYRSNPQPSSPFYPSYPIIYGISSTNSTIGEINLTPKQ